MLFSEQISMNATCSAGVPARRPVRTSDRPIGAEMVGPHPAHLRAGRPRYQGPARLLRYKWIGRAGQETGAVEKGRDTPCEQTGC